MVQNIFHAQSEIAFAIQTGADIDALKEQFGLDDVEAKNAIELYNAGCDLELVKLAQLRKPILNPTSIPEEETVAHASEPLPAPPKPTHGYEVTARLSNVFIRPLPKDHVGRLITPAAYDSNSDMGFVHTVGPNVTDIKPGSLVLFDRFAEVGAHYNLVVEGELTELVMVREEFILAVLERVEL